MTSRVNKLQGIKIIPDAGHFVPLERATEVSNIIVTFMRNLDSEVWRPTKVI